MPLSPDRLLPQWPALRRAGLLSFVIRYGLLRFAPPLVGVALGANLALHRGTAVALIASALVQFVVGALWAVATWNTCERRARAQASS